MMTRIPNLLLRQVALLLLLTGVAGLIFFTLRTYLPAFLGAYTLYVLLLPLMVWLTERKRWPTILAALFIVLLSAAALGGLLYLLVQMVREPLLSVLQHSQDIVDSLQGLVRYYQQEYHLNIITPENVQAVAGWLSKQAQILLTATIESAVLVLLTAFVLYYMLVNHHRLEKAFYQWLPFSKSNVSEFKERLNALVFSNAVGIPLTGLIQGIAGGLFYWLIGVPYLWAWFALTCIAGMLPVVGVALAYVPLSAYLLAEGAPEKALAVFIYGFVVIGSVDNLSRMWLQQRLGETHPLITLFGFIAGIQLFGFIGLVFGPILIALFLLAVRIYGREFGQRGRTT